MKVGKITGTLGGIEGTDENGNPINKIGLWTKSGFIETPVEKLFPEIKKKKNESTRSRK